MWMYNQVHVHFELLTFVSLQSLPGDDSRSGDGGASVDTLTATPLLSVDRLFKLFSVTVDKPRFAM